MKGNVVRLIEYQEEIQRNPEELISFLDKEIKDEQVTEMLVIYKNGKDLYYVPASVSRGYTKMNILWDVEQWKSSFISESD